MAPTSRIERRQWNRKAGTKDLFEDDTTNAKESENDFDLDGELSRRILAELLGLDGDENDNEDIDGHEDRRRDLGLPGLPLPHLSLPQPSLPSLPPNPLSGLLSPPKSDPPNSSPPPPATNPPGSSPPPPSTNSPGSSPPPPSTNPPDTAPPAAAPPQQASSSSSSSSPLSPSSASTPPQQSATGITGNFGSASPSSNPQRTTVSAALPKSTGSGDGDGGDDDGDGNTTSAPSPTRTTFSKSTRSILSLTPAIVPYETYTTEEDGHSFVTSRPKTPTSSLTTFSTLPAQTLETTTTIDVNTVTGTSSPSATETMDQGREAAHSSHLSPGGEKAIIATLTIAGTLILLALAWFFWCRSTKRKSPGRKSVWPTSFPPPNVVDASRRVSSKVGEKITSVKGHLRKPSAFSLCSVVDEAADNEKAPAPVAAKAGGLLERRLERGLGTTTPPQRVTVNSYGMIFRKPKRDSLLSDIFLPRRQREVSPLSSPAEPNTRETVVRGPSIRGPTPPSPEEIRIPILRPGVQTAAAAHLQNARKSVNAGAYAPRTPKAPMRRHHRASVASSSLSSGFGDGDIVIMQPPATAATGKAAHPSVIDSLVNLVAVRRGSERKSVSSRPSRSSRDRDTVITDESEDMKPRFRSISSWVNQQSRRTKRAATSRGEDGVPDVPDVLPEQQFDMMMPDEQEPRRVESGMWRRSKGRDV